MKTFPITLILVSSLIFAQDAALTKGLGFAGGMPSGSGFSYRQMNDDYGFQITGGLMAFNNDDDDNYYSFVDHPLHGDWLPNTKDIFTQELYTGSEFWGNLGISYYKPLHIAKKATFYGLFAASTYLESNKKMTRDFKYSISADSTKYSYQPIGPSKEKRVNDFTGFIGAGLGIGYKLSNNVRIHLEMPITFASNGNIYMYIPQGGIHYYFR